MELLSYTENIVIPFIPCNGVREVFNVTDPRSMSEAKACDQCTDLAGNIRVTAKAFDGQMVCRCQNAHFIERSGS